MLVIQVLLTLLRANRFAFLFELLDFENVLNVFDDGMAVFEKLIQFDLLIRLEVCRSLARSPPTLMVLIRVLLTLFEGDTGEASGGRRLFKDRLITMILVFLNDH